MSAPKLKLVEPRPPKKTKAASPDAKKRAAVAKPKKRETIAADLMSSPAVSCSVHASLNDAARMMWEQNLGALVVVDDDNCPVGMLTDRDISMAAYTQGVPLYHAAVTSAMSRTLATAKTSATIDELRAIMSEAIVRRVPIVDETNRLCGIVGLGDVVTETVAPVPKDRKRGTSPAMLVQLTDALFSPAEAG